MSGTLAEALHKDGIIDDVQLAAAQARQEQWGGHLLTHLVGSGIDEAALVRRVAERFGVAAEYPLPPLVDAQAMRLLPVELCAQALALPLAQLADGKVRVAVADPTDRAGIDAIVRRIGTGVELVVSGPIAIAEAIKAHYATAGSSPATEGGVELPVSDEDDDDMEIEPVAAGMSGGADTEHARRLSERVDIGDLFDSVGDIPSDKRVVTPPPVGGGEPTPARGVRPVPPDSRASTPVIETAPDASAAPPPTRTDVPTPTGGFVAPASPPAGQPPVHKAELSPEEELVQVRALVRDLSLQHGALLDLLVAKGLITREEYREALHRQSHEE